VFVPCCEFRRTCAAAKSSDPHGQRPIPGQPTVPSPLRRWATPSPETPTYPVPGERLVTITHAFRHIF